MATQSKAHMCGFEQSVTAAKSSQPAFAERRFRQSRAGIFSGGRGPWGNRKEGGGERERGNLESSIKSGVIF